jgi:hypothetical protein
MPKQIDGAPNKVVPSALLSSEHSWNSSSKKQQLSHSLMPEWGSPSCLGGELRVGRLRTNHDRLRS